MTLAADTPSEVTGEGPAADATLARDTLGVVSLFSGIAGLDSGMETAGAEVRELCESWGPARRVLAAHYPDIPVHDDVASFRPRHDFEVLAAGFPCTDLSHAGSKAGIFGPQSGLVEHVFRIAAASRPEWVLLENVPNLLALHQAAGIREVTERLEALGYDWAYRTVDSRFTGVPQRRFRVIILASALRDPAPFLFGDDTVPPDQRLAAATDRRQPARVAAGDPDPLVRPHGFYWTEGRYGIGAVDGAIPTLKGGSKLGIPSAPAIWFPSAPLGRRFVLPRIEDGERLQGLPVGWTDPAVVPGEPDPRWKLLGNAVTRGVGSWVADRIGNPSNSEDPYLLHLPFRTDATWPRAAQGGPGRRPLQVLASDHPQIVPMIPLQDIVDVDQAPPLSYRATRGFLSRLDEKHRRVDMRIYSDLEKHMAATRPKQPPEKDPSWASSPQSRARMQAQKQRDTKPEILMRRELTALGLRYQLQRRPETELRARLDIVFKGPRVAVDIRGCFWHSCPQHGTKPKLNKDRWEEKLRRNRERDAETVRALEERGWIVCVVWEHDDPVQKAREVAAIVEHRKKATPPRRAPRTP